MIPVLQFTVPGLPVAKGRAKSSARVVNGKAFTRHYTPAKTRNFEAMVKDLAAQAMAGKDPLTGPLDLVAEFRFPIPDSWPAWRKRLAEAGLVHHTQKPDCSNLLKAIEDAMNAVAWHDDGQVVGAIQDKAWTSGMPCVVVRVYPRAGVSPKATKAEAEAALATYDATTDTRHRALAFRLLAV